MINYKSILRRYLALIAMIMIITFAFFETALAGSEGDVIEGKDGWLFYTGENENILKDYAGTNLFTDAQLTEIRSRLKRIQGYCDERGIDFIVFLAPNKEHIYSEYMPDEYGQPASYTRIEQLVDYLSDEFCVVTPMNSLYAAKQSMPQYDYYYKTDTHWNELGGYIGAKDLLNVMGYSLPDLSALSIDSLVVPGKDIARMIDTEFITLDVQYTPKGYGSYTTTEEDLDDGLIDIIYHTQGAPSRSMTIVGDSYALAMAPYLGQYFDNIYVHRTFDLSRQELEKEQPSVLVYEQVERLFDYFLMADLTD